MTKSERLREFIKIVYDGNNTSLAKAIDITPQALYSYLKDKRGIGSQMLEKLWAIGCSNNWLMYGQGDIFADNEAGRRLRASQKPGPSNVKVIHEPGEEIIHEKRKYISNKYKFDKNETHVTSVKPFGGKPFPVRYFSEPAGAGTKPVLDGGEQEIDLVDFITSQRDDEIFVAEVSGDSMTQAGVCSGDVLMINRSLNPEDFEIVVAFIDGNLLVKRYRIIDGKEYLFSDNPNYLPIEINGYSSIEIFGVVENVIHRLGRIRKF